MNTSPSPEILSKLLEKHFKDRLLADIKEPLMNLAEELIDEIVDKAIKDMAPKIRAYRNMFRDVETYEVEVTKSVKWK